MDDYLTKPLRAEELRVILQHWINGNFAADDQHTDNAAAQRRTDDRAGRDTDGNLSRRPNA
jgi:DNA-binding response OmpR family regulator